MKGRERNETETKEEGEEKTRNEGITRYRRVRGRETERKGRESSGKTEKGREVRDLINGGAGMRKTMEKTMRKERRVAKVIRGDGKKRN